LPLSPYLLFLAVLALVLLLYYLAHIFVVRRMVEDQAKFIRCAKARSFAKGENYPRQQKGGTTKWLQGPLQPAAMLHVDNAAKVGKRPIDHS
jgi:hypothetical protein